MAEVRHLKNAPITEALLDIKVGTSSDADFPAERLDQLEQDLAEAYPIVEKRKLRKVKLQISPAETSSNIQESGVLAYWFFTEKKNRIAQFRFDGFTYNMLKPYTSWEEMQKEGLRLWEIYEDIFKPPRIVRIATRFINHVTLQTQYDLEDYLTDMPFGIENMPGKTIQFMNQVSLLDDHENSARVVVASDDSNSPMITILADIDVFRDGEIKVPVDMKSLTATLAQLRAFKNEIFFSIFTEKALSQYE